MKKSIKGFTLIELMIAVAIIAILSAIAIPTYNGYISKSRRVDAQGALTALAQAMERYNTENSTYMGASLGSSGIFPNEAPLDNNTKYYDLTFDTNDPLSQITYKLVATPKGGQAGDGVLTLDETGARTWDGNAGWD